MRAWHDKSKGVRKMIKADAMGEFIGPVMLPGGIDLGAIREALAEAAQQNNIPLAFSTDEVKSGGLFNKVSEPCLVLYHPEHEFDYFRFAVRSVQEGGRSIVTINTFGQSSQMKKDARAAWAKQDRRGKSMSYKVGSMIGSGIAGIGRSKQKLEAEQRYYMLVQDLIEQVFA